ncbi:MAG: GMC family oxidoreductase [Bacteroidia bacterium]|nr:GMC family oxidoreductase [Bacteroidia bacterium]
MKTTKDDILNLFDLCIIGTGPAGIILALEYAALNPLKKIALIEFGARHQEGPNQLDESISINNPINHYGPYDCTNKGLGGTSRTWGGRCVMYDEIDFVPRPIVNNDCTWEPSLFDDVCQYTAKTSQYFECGSDTFDLDKIPNSTPKRIAEGFIPDYVTDSRLERWSMPTRFGDRYEKQLDDAQNIYLFESYKAHKFICDNGNINAAILKHTSDNSEIELKALDFVLAAGAQESTRILLKNTQIFDALGFVPDALGKFYQSHISGKIASVKFFGNPKLTDYGFQKEKDVFVRRRFQFTTDFILKKNLLNTAFWLDNPLYHDPVHKNGAMSFMYLAMITPILGKKLAPPAIKHSVTKGKVNGLGKHFLNLLRDFPMSFITPFSIFYKRYMPERKLPGVFLYNSQNAYALHFHSEQIPDKSNQMYLDQDGESLKIDYQLLDEDVDAIVRGHKELDAYLKSINCGQLEFWFPDDQLKEAVRNGSKDGIHQSGTTRMADSAQDGVVDTNLKVFGTSNLYICSSSVFPTSGQANPTYFLGAFAVRLANYLKHKNEVHRTS